MLKSFTTRVKALEINDSNYRRLSNRERLSMLSERHEMEAKIIEAQLNLDRIAATSGNREDSQPSADDFSPGR
jgi:hypothetical protein